jgi:chorismate synthase
MEALIRTIKKTGDTVGGVISCVIKNSPIGLGEPVFDRLNAGLAKAMFSINAVKGFELGSGFSAVQMKGSEHNDEFEVDENGKVKTTSNLSGGIQGGISNGEDIYFNVAFKPVATIIQKQNTVNSSGENVDMMGKGRHDPCVVPRAVPIVEAMSAMVILDYLMLFKARN